jgi:hypothetical protein
LLQRFGPGRALQSRRQYDRPRLAGLRRQTRRFLRLCGWILSGLAERRRGHCKHKNCGCRGRHELKISTESLAHFIFLASMKTFSGDAQLCAPPGIF